MSLAVDSTAVMVLYTAIMIMFYCVLPGTYAVSFIKEKMKERKTSFAQN